MSERPARLPPSRADALALALLAVAVAARFYPWLTLRLAFFQVDLGFMDHPLRVHVARLLGSGRFPVWSDGLLAGFPVFAAGEAGVLYPGSWLYLVLPPLAALNAFVIGHVMLLAGTTYAFLRARPLTPAASAFGAASLALSGFVLTEHVLMGALAVTAWLPLLLLLLEAFVRDGRRRHLATASAVVGVMHLAGDPLASLVSLSLAVGFAAAAGAPGAWRRRALAASVPLLLGTALAAVQLVPSWEFLGQTGRAANGPGARFPLPGRLLLLGLFPRWFGGTGREYFGPGVWEESLLVFAGWMPLLLAVFAATRRRAARGWWLASVAALVLSLAPFHGLGVWSWPPLSWFRWPGRFLVWHALAVATAAAYGLDAACEAAAGWRRGAWAVAGLAAAGGVAFLAWGSDGLPASGAAGVSAARALAWRRVDLAGLVACAAALIVAVALRRSGRIGERGVVAVAFAGLVAGIGWQPGPRGVATEAYREPASARAVAECGGRFLAVSPWDAPFPPDDTASFARAVEGLGANAHLLFGLRSISQFDLAHTTTLSGPQAVLRNPSRASLDLLAVDGLVAPGDVSGALDRLREQDRGAAGLGPWPPDGFERRLAGAVDVYCRTAPLERAFLAFDHEVVSRQQAWNSVRTGGTDLRDTVLLEEAPEWPPGGSPAPEDSVALVTDEPTHLEIDVLASAPALLVVADSHDPAWHAWLDGEPVPVLRADGFVRAVAVPAGRHRVQMRYVPGALRTGAAVSFGALAAVALLAASDRRS